jgi:hypothetical protein
MENVKQIHALAKLVQPEKCAWRATVRKTIVAPPMSAKVDESVTPTRTNASMTHAQV